MKNLILLPGFLIIALLAACAGNNTPASSNSPSPSSSTPPASSNPTTPASGEKVSFSVAQSIIQSRCFMCHSGAGARVGVNFDNKDQIKKYADRIKARAVDSKGMPQGNATGMTDAERQTLGAWITQGASLD